MLNNSVSCRDPERKSLTRKCSEVSLENICEEGTRSGRSPALRCTLSSITAFPWENGDAGESRASKDLERPRGLRKLLKRKAIRGVERRIIDHGTIYAPCEAFLQRNSSARYVEAGVVAWSRSRGHQATNELGQG